MKWQFNSVVGNAGRKSFSIAVVGLLVAGAFMALPMTMDTARGWMSPDMGGMYTLGDIAMMTGGMAVEDMGPGMYLIHEPLTIMPSDTLMIEPGLIVMVDPFMGISIEIMGMLDAGMAGGTMFMCGGGPGSWDGIRVLDSGSLFASGLTIMDAIDGIYIDHSFGFGMVQIDGCVIFGCMNTGITMIGTMGGPMVGWNMVQGCPTGMYLRDTSAQCFNNEVTDCGVGIQVEGDFSPSINSCQIHDNYVHGVYLNDANSVGIMGSSFYNNVQDNIYFQDSGGNVDGNRIYAFNATPGSGEVGRNGIVIDATVDWGQVWITNNWILGGNGDENADGGHAILVESYGGDPFNGMVENVVIMNNPLLRGGNGGLNMLPVAGTAGNGGNAIRVNELPAEEDWFTGQQSLVVESNAEIIGGRGGDNMAPMEGNSGQGGDAILVLNPDTLGNVRITDNVRIQGGDGGLNMAMPLPLNICGGGGSAVRCEDVYLPGSRIGNTKFVIGGNDGGPMRPSYVYGGYGVRLERCWNFEMDNVSGNTQWFLAYERECEDISITRISIQDSDVNSGGLVKVEDSNGWMGNNENWDFGGAHRTTGVLIMNSTEIGVRTANVGTEGQPGIVLLNSSGIVLDDFDVYALDTTGIEVIDCSEVLLNGTGLIMNWTVEDEPQRGIAVNGSSNVTGAGLIMEWNSTTPANWSSAFKLEYFMDGCSDCRIMDSDIHGGVGLQRSSGVGIARTNITNENGPALGVLDCSGIFVIDSFFDVTFDTSKINNTGVEMANLTGALVQNTRVVVQNGSAIRLQDADDAGFDGFEGENKCLPTGAFPSSPCKDSDNLTFSNCRFIGENGGGLEMVNCNRSFIIDSFFDITYDISASNELPGISVSNSVGAELENIEMLVRNTTGISAMNVIGLNISKLDLNVPHAGYGGHATVFKAVARGGASNSVVNVTSGPTFTWGTDLNFTVNYTLYNVSYKGTGGGGIRLLDSRDNTIEGCTVQGKDEGARLVNCEDNLIFHNNFIGNLVQAYDDTVLNTWDDGYPSGGNYWSDYAGPDIMNGPLQDQPGPDGIGDGPYLNIQGAGAMDNYPLTDPWTPPEPETFNVSLGVGWNLVSSPLELEDTFCLEVFLGISGKYDLVMGYDALDASDVWKSFRPGAGTNDLTDVDHTMGVWVHATEACTLTFTGYIPDSTAIMLHTGWNLVSYPSLAPMAPQDALAGTGFDRIECFDPAAPYVREMLPAEMMLPGCGYWVHVPADTIWIIDW